MKKQLTIKERQEVLINVLLEGGEKYAIFGIEKEIAKPLIEKGYLHKDTFRYTGGATLTKKGRELKNTKNTY